MNGESEGVGMKGEDVKEWITERETGKYHQEKLDKQSTCESINTWVESSIGEVRHFMRECKGKVGWK